jgi:hypothetical protein
LQFDLEIRQMKSKSQNPGQVVLKFDPQNQKIWPSPSSRGKQFSNSSFSLIQQMKSKVEIQDNSVLRFDQAQVGTEKVEKHHWAQKSGHRKTTDALIDSNRFLRWRFPKNSRPVDMVDTLSMSMIIAYVWLDIHQISETNRFDQVVGINFNNSPNTVPVLMPQMKSKVEIQDKSCPEIWPR